MELLLNVQDKLDGFFLVFWMMIAFVIFIGGILVVLRGNGDI